MPRKKQVFHKGVRFSCWADDLGRTITGYVVDRKVIPYFGVELTIRWNDAFIVVQYCYEDEALYNVASGMWRCWR